MGVKIEDAKARITPVRSASAGPAASGPAGSPPPDVKALPAFAGDRSGIFRGAASEMSLSDDMSFEVKVQAPAGPESPHGSAEGHAAPTHADPKKHGKAIKQEKPAKPEKPTSLLDNANSAVGYIRKGLAGLKGAGVQSPVVDKAAGKAAIVAGVSSGVHMTQSLEKGDYAQASKDAADMGKNVMTGVAPFATASAAAKLKGGAGGAGVVLGAVALTTGVDQTVHGLKSGDGSTVARGVQSTVKGTTDVLKGVGDVATSTAKLVGGESAAVTGLKVAGKTLGKLNPLGAGVAAIAAARELPTDVHEGHYVRAGAHALEATGGALMVGGAVTAATGVGVVPGAVAGTVGGAMMVTGTVLEVGEAAYDALAAQPSRKPTQAEIAHAQARWEARATGGREERG